MPHDYLDRMYLEYHGLDENGLPKHEDWEHAAHYDHEEKLLRWRNVCVTVAAGLFVASLLPVTGHSAGFCKAAAYFVGAGAYILELATLTDGFRRREPFREMYMPYLFAPLYVLLGISYLLH